MTVAEDRGGSIRYMGAVCGVPRTVWEDEVSRTPQRRGDGGGSRRGVRASRDEMSPGYGDRWVHSQLF